MSRKKNNNPNHGWTEERRARQAEQIRSWSPWHGATGPRTPQGKSKSRMNALKGGGYSTSVRRLKRVMRLIESFEREKEARGKS